MKRLRVTLTIGLAPALMMGCLAAVGCNSNKNSEQQGQVSNEGGKQEGEKPEAKAGPKEELADTGWGTLKGKVTLAGDKPKPGEIVDPNKDPKVCSCQAAKDKGDTLDQSWKVGNDGGVANVVVWLRAPKGKVFRVPDDKKKVEEPVTLAQPFCAFEPHVLVMFPSYYDVKAKGQKKTGQQLRVINNALQPEPISHNTKADPADSGVNDSHNELIPAGKELLWDFNPSKKNASGGEQLINFSCTIHTWMKGYGWVFDHPFTAVSSGDQKNDPRGFGSYEIKNAPADVDLELVYWHEGMSEPKVV
ncbi:MAG: hypothetical protein JO112_00035, partial [Planctomycetes bacterium]|nr:hypothetical protein [Planctomycetota bacterium]